MSLTTDVDARGESHRSSCHSVNIGLKRERLSASTIKCGGNNAHAVESPKPGRDIGSLTRERTGSETSSPLLPEVCYGRSDVAEEKMVRAGTFSLKCNSARFTAKNSKWFKWRALSKSLQPSLTTRPLSDTSHPSSELSANR